MGDDGEPHGAVHQGGFDELGAPREAERVGAHSPGSPHRGRPAGQGSAVVPEQHAGVEHGDGSLEVTVPERAEKGLDDLPLTARIDVPGRRGTLDPPAGTAGELAGRSRGAFEDGGDLVERHGEDVVQDAALFGHLGVEWNIPQAGPGELAGLAAWIALYKDHRALIHTGRMIRLDTPDDTAWMYGVVAADQSAALLSYVQLDQPRSDQPAAMRVPGLDPARRYRATDVTPGQPPPRQAGLAGDPIPRVEATGGALAGIGLAIPAQRALTALVVLVEAV